MKKFILSAIFALFFLFPSVGSAIDGERVIQGIEITGSIQFGTEGTFETPYDNAITVAAEGGDYTDLSDAVDAASAGDTILVYPGTYTDSITVAVNNLSIISMGGPLNTTLTQADANLIDFGATTGGRIVNFTLNLSAATTAINAIQGSTGNFQVKMCRTMVTSAAALNQADQPRAAKITGAGTIFFSLGKVIYNHTGTCTTGSAIKAPLEAATGGVVKVYNLNTLDVNGSGSALATAVGLSVGTGYIVVDNCDIDVDDDTTTYTVGLGYLSSATSVDNEFSYNVIHVHGDANNAYGVFAINSTVRSSHNHIHVECSGAGTAYSFAETGTGTINSHMDDVIATGGYSGNVNIVASESDGDLTVSGDIEGGAITGKGVATFSPDATNETLQINDGSVDFSDGNAGTAGTLTVDASGNLSYNKNFAATDLDGIIGSNTPADGSFTTFGATGISQFGTASGVGQVNVTPTTAITALQIKTQENAGATDGINVVDSDDAEVFAVDSDGNSTATSYTADPTSAPGVSFTDSDGDDNDVSAKIYHNLTTTGTGAEVGDVYFQSMAAGSLSTFMWWDGSEGLVTVNGDVTATGNVAGATYGSDSSVSDAELLKIDNSPSTTDIAMLELATDAEVAAFTDESRAVTPEGLGYALAGVLAYGVSWDEDESSPTLTRTGALAGIAAASSPGDACLPIQAAMVRVVLADDGSEVYELCPTDSTKKADCSTASNLDGTDGQIMVRIDKFAYKYTYDAATNVHDWSISSVLLPGYEWHPAFYKDGAWVDHRYIGAYEGIGYDNSTSAYFDGDDVGDTKTQWPGGTAIDTGADKLGSVSGFAPLVNETRAEFGAIAVNRGTGWRQQDFYLVSAIQLLYVVEYASWYSQDVIGMGRTELSGGTWAKDSYIGVTGKSNGDGNATANTGGDTNDAYMSYRGIENFFGNVWKWVDGFNINDGIPYVSNVGTDFADDTATNYDRLEDTGGSGITLPQGSNDYQTTLEQTKGGFLPSAVGGNSSTYITDYYYQSTGWRVARLGGVAADAASAGAFDWVLSSGSTSVGVSRGSRISF